MRCIKNSALLDFGRRQVNIAPPIKTMNDYKIIEDYAIVYINRKGQIYECYVDIEDLERMRKFNRSWHICKTNGFELYYATNRQYIKKGKYIITYLHRWVLNLDDSDNRVVDHINHNTLDNRKSNLRVIEYEENIKNRKGANKNTTSGYRNVSWSNSGRKWLVQIQVNGKNTCFGRFDSDQLEDAIELAKKLRQKHYGEFAGV